MSMFECVSFVCLLNKFLKVHGSRHDFSPPSFVLDKSSLIYVHVHDARERKKRIVIMPRVFPECSSLA